MVQGERRRDRRRTGRRADRRRRPRRRSGDSGRARDARGGTGAGAPGGAPARPAPSPDRLVRPCPGRAGDGRRIRHPRRRSDARPRRDPLADRRPHRGRGGRRGLPGGRAGVAHRPGDRRGGDGGPGSPGRGGPARPTGGRDRRRPARYAVRRDPTERRLAGGGPRWPSADAGTAAVGAGRHLALDRREPTGGVGGTSRRRFGPAGVPAAAAAVAGERSVGGPPAPAPRAADELAAARASLAAGDRADAAVRLSVVLRVSPSLAPAVLDVAAGEPGPEFDLVRGDALRLVGHESQARRSYAAAVSRLGADASRTGDGSPPDVAPADPEVDRRRDPSGGRSPGRGGGRDRRPRRPKRARPPRTTSHPTGADRPGLSFSRKHPQQR